MFSRGSKGFLSGWKLKPRLLAYCIEPARPVHPPVRAGNQGNSQEPRTAKTPRRGAKKNVNRNTKA